MDLHPIFVHFPIALLTIYSLIELLAIKFRKNLTLFYVKATFLIIGVGGAIFSLLSGEIAAKAYTLPDLKRLVAMHELWANITTYIFLTIAIAYFLEWLSLEFREPIQNSKYNNFFLVLMNIKKVLYSAPLIYFLTMVGLVGITLTGALGGAIVYGPEADPLVSIIYNLLL